ELPWTVRQADVSQSVSLARTTLSAPAWAAAMGRVTNYVMNDCGGGRRGFKLAWGINFPKLATISLLSAFLFRYHNTGTAAWIYFAMQSSYGLSWIVKDFAFPDSNFHKRITIGAGIASFLTVLGWYWLFGWLLISADAPLRRNAHLPVEKSQAF